jgi:hypothetical protein
LAVVLAVLMMGEAAALVALLSRLSLLRLVLL